jgi:hypothetical protein
MASTAALDLVISLKSEGAESGLKTMASHVSALGTAVGTFAGGAALAGVRALGGAISGFLGDAIQESRDAAHGLAQTEAVIKSTGAAAGVTSAQIVDMAGALSHSTLFTDDAIQADENLLLTFTNLKNGVGAGNDIFTQATKVSLDLAQAMGTDAAGGAVQLGKALNDPTAGISALTRVGVTFTDAQKGMIKSLQDSGDLMGAQKIILGELNKEFGGSAEAAAKADGGFHLFNQRLSDVKQTIGDALQPALRTMTGFMAGPGMDAIERLGTAFAREITQVTAFADAILRSGDPLGALEAHINRLLPGFTGTVTAITSVAGVIHAQALPAISALGAATVLYAATSLPGMVAAVTTSTTALAGQATAMLATLGPFALVAAAAAGAAVVYGHWVNGIGKVVDATDRHNEILRAAADAQRAYMAVDPTPGMEDQHAALDALTEAHRKLEVQIAKDTDLNLFGANNGYIRDETAALAENEQQIARTAASLRELAAASSLNAFQAQFGDDRRDSIMGYTAAVTEATTAIASMPTWSGPSITALANTGSAFQSASEAVTPFSRGVTDASAAIASFGTFAQPTIEAMNTLSDSLATTISQSSAVFGTLIASVASSYDQLTQTTADHEDKIAALVAEKADAKTNAARQGIDDRIAAENTGYASELAAQLVAQGEQLAAQREHLGEMLIQQINTMTQLGQVSQERAAALVAGIRTEYGVLPDLAATSFGSMQASISQWASDASISAESVITKLHLTGAEADSTRQLMEQMAKKYEAELVENFKEGKIDADQLKAAVAGIPARVESLLTTNWASELAQIRAIGGAMGALPTSKLIRIEAGIDPMLMRHSPSPIEQVMASITAFEKQAHVFRLDAQADKLKGVLDMLSALKGAGAGLGSLVTFKAPSIASITAFTASTKTIVTSLGTVAQTFKTKWLEQAGVFMDAAGKGLGIISNGVDGLNKLRTFRAPSIASVNAFTDSVLVIVQSLGTAAQIFKDEWLTHAQTFFDTAGKGLGIIGAGVDGLTKLRTFRAPSIASINAFTDTVMVIVQSLGTAAQIFKDAWLAKASAFEDTAGKGLAIIGAGVDGLTKLAAFKAPSIAAINAFTDTVTLLVQSLGTVAQTFKDVWLAKAGVFADAAAKGIGIIGAGVEGFTKLSTYRGIAPAALRLFAADLQMVMDTMIGIAQDLGTKGPAAAAVFGDAVGRTIAPIGAAIDTFTKLKDYKGVARDAVILIGNDMVGVIATLGIIAQSAQGAGVAAAVAFADSAGVIFGALKTAIDALNSLAGLSKDGKAISAGLGVLAQGLADLQVVMSAIDWSASLGAWQDSFLVLFTGLMDTVFVPWQTMTRDFFSGAGFGFIGAASEGMNSAGGGLAASASNVGAMAGSSLVSSLQSNVAGVSGVVDSINAQLARIERDIHIKVSIDRGGGTGQTSWNESIGI